MNILDIHTHNATPSPEAVISCSPAEIPPYGLWPGQLYSVGFHSWTLTDREPSGPEWENLARILERDDVVAVGECGIDIPRGGPLFRQMQVLQRHTELAERLGKPMVLHCVKGQEQIIGMHRDLRPTVPWLVHGFRGKPSVADMFLRAGIRLSFGPKFNPDSLRLISRDRLLAETDDPSVGIEDVITAFERERGETDLRDSIAANSRRFLFGQD